MVTVPCYYSDNDVIVQNSTFTENSADDSGGGIYNYNDQLRDMEQYLC